MATIENMKGIAPIMLGMKKSEIGKEYMATP